MLAVRKACSCSEMAAKGESGIRLDLDKVPLRETGMMPYEILLSESQERTEFIETDCSIVFDGVSFESGGAFLMQQQDTGKRSGILYAFTKGNGAATEVSVGTWDGSRKVKAIRGREWVSNFGDIRQSVWFKWQGIPYYGIWYKSGSDIIRCRETNGWRGYNALIN